MKIKTMLLSLLIAVGTAGIVLAQPYDYPAGGMMAMMYGQYGIGFAVLSWFTSLLVIGLLITGIYWLVKSANRKK